VLLLREPKAANCSTFLLPRFSARNKAVKLIWETLIAWGTLVVDPRARTPVRH